MINNDQSTLLLFCPEDVKSHRSGNTVPLNESLYHGRVSRHKNVNKDITDN